MTQNCLIGSSDLSALRPKGYFVNAACDFQSFGMISNGDVFVAPFDGGSCHCGDGPGAVAPARVHLQIAAQKIFASPGFFLEKHSRPQG
ncbi:MAG: hypothetical protein DMF24_10600 [Verrucomicrobia bacterium]|nr:MAG: hypothetical protein DME90_06360 [Verrucomicrobiota bacterium]PYL60273.1 MAG: hypothetical protein DMF24_10600 [Verrucomicrobiota bacterium]